MSFGSIVELYRKCGLPEIEDGAIKVDIQADEQIFKSLQTVHRAYGYLFREVLIDGKEYFEGQELEFPDNGHLEFEFVLPTDSDNKFYEDTNDLLKNSGRVCKGKLPDQFYIIDSDYFNEDNRPSDRVKTLASICKVIELLSKIAHYHDQKTASDSHKLVFINPDEGSDRPAIVLETCIEPVFLDQKPLDYSILEDLANTSRSSDPHLVAKKGVFWSSLAEFLAKIEQARKAFFNLISEWDAFLDLYQKNLETYLSGFAFHKAKRDVAQAELNLASQFSSVIGDITGKLLAIPVSVGALLAIDKVDNIFEQVIFNIGLFISSLLIVGVVDNQQRQFGRISHAKDVVLGSFEGKKEQYPEDLVDAVDNMVTNLNKNEVNLKATLYFFRCLAWVPFILSVVVVLAINSVK